MAERIITKEERDKAHAQLKDHNQSVFCPCERCKAAEIVWLLYERQQRKV